MTNVSPKVLVSAEGTVSNNDSMDGFWSMWTSQSKYFLRKCLEARTNTVVAIDS